VTPDPTAANPPREGDRALERGTSGPTADLAVEGRPTRQDCSAQAPYTRPAEPIAEGQAFDQLAEKKAVVGDAQEALLDEAVEESFPASDPPSIGRA
jgi:hypothetical protein